MQLLLKKMPNPKVKWELIRKAKKQQDIRFERIYINPDLTPEQRNLEFETRTSARDTTNKISHRFAQWFDEYESFRYSLFNAWLHPIKSQQKIDK